MDQIIVKSEPLKITQKEIFRLAASLYADMTDTYSTVDTQLQMIKLAFLEKDNAAMSYDEIAAVVLSLFKYHLSEDEIISVLARNKKDFQAVEVEGRVNHSLSAETFQTVSTTDSRTIDYYIDLYAQENNADCAFYKETVHRFLYELTTTNINSYNVLLAGKQGIHFSDDDLTVNTDDFTDEETLLVKGFLDWENEEKNEALGNIVLCCLEYCLLVNGDAPNKLLKEIIRHREIYLDTNVIFRALGIDGPARKKVVLAFLDKCKQANLTIIISSQTKKEFVEAIEHYISQIQQYSRGSIYLGAAEQLSGYTIFSFYEEWLDTHRSLSTKSFKYYIDSAYDNLVSQYNILDNERIPNEIFISDSFRECRNRYAQSIKTAKLSARLFYFDSYGGYSKTDVHDASLIRYIELKREQSAEDKDIFLVSSDKALRYWDMSRSEIKYPVVIYPSQLFLMLIKLCGRSENDFDSFVSFINIRPKSEQISPEKANAIISGISAITEDIATQKLLVSSVYSEDFQDIIRRSNTDLELYENTKQFSMQYMDAELRKREEEANQQKAEISQLRFATQEQEEQIKNLQSDLSELNESRSSAEENLKNQSGELAKSKDQIRKLAEKQITPKFYWKSYCLPAVVSLIALMFAAFIVLQFCLRDKSWNFAVNFYSWASQTYFGQKVGDFVYIIDGIFLSITVWLMKKYFKNPFNKEKRNSEKEAMIDKCIKDIEQQ